MLIIVLSLLFAAVTICVAFIASILTDRRWVAHADVQSGRVLCAGRAYWVVDADDPEACCLLMELLQLEHERREDREKVARMRQGADPL